MCYNPRCLPAAGSTLLLFFLRAVDLVSLCCVSSWVFSAFLLFETTSFGCGGFSLGGGSFLTTLFFVVLSFMLLATWIKKTSATNSSHRLRLWAVSDLYLFLVCIIMVIIFLCPLFYLGWFWIFRGGKSELWMIQLLHLLSLFNYRMIIL